MIGMGSLPTSVTTGASTAASGIGGYDFSGLFNNLGGIGAGLGVGMSGYGQYQAGQEAGEATEYNAMLMRQRAAATRDASKAETTAMGKRARRLKSTQEAVYSGTGAQIGAGTPLMVMAEQAGEMQRDILERRRTRMIEEQQLRSRADYMSEQAKKQKKSGKWGGLGTIVGGGLGLALGGPAGAVLGSQLGGGLGGALGGS
jgi:hypothetical protein